MPTGDRQPVFAQPYICATKLRQLSAGYFERLRAWAMAWQALRGFGLGIVRFTISEHLAPIADAVRADAAAGAVRLPAIETRATMSARRSVAA
jgi:hypothetical protein